MNKRITLLLSTSLLAAAHENKPLRENHPLGAWVEPADVDVVQADENCISYCPDPKRPYAPAGETDPQETGSRRKNRCRRRGKKGFLFCPPVVDPWTPEQELELRNIYDEVSEELDKLKEKTWQEVEFWRDLMWKRLLAIRRNGFQAVGESPMIREAPRVPIAITDLAGGATPSVVVTNGDLSFGEGPARRRIPGPNANCAWIPWCNQQQFHEYGGNGGGFCNGCKAKYGQKCKSKIMGISIYSTRHLIAGMAVNWENPEDNGLYDYGEPSFPNSLCGSTKGWEMSIVWDWKAMSPVPQWEIHDPWYEDLSQWDCIRAVTGHAGAMLDGIQFWGYKKMSWGYETRRTQYYGGYGGTYFEANAPTGKCLTGIMFMDGSYVDKLYLNFGGYW